MNVESQYHHGAATERAGAVRAAKSADAIRAKIHAIVVENPCTDEQLFAYYEGLYGTQSSTFFGNTFRRRRLELKQMGLIVDSGVRRTSSAGIPCIVWAAA